MNLGESSSEDDEDDEADAEGDDGKTAREGHVEPVDRAELDLYERAMMRLRSGDADDAYNMLEEDVQMCNVSSERIAVVNMDWDKLTAMDIFAVMNSFVRDDGGRVVRVMVYPSDYGLEKMAEEEKDGPSRLLGNKRGAASVGPGELVRPSVGDLMAVRQRAAEGRKMRLSEAGRKAEGHDDGHADDANEEESDSDIDSDDKRDMEQAAVAGGGDVGALGIRIKGGEVISTEDVEARGKDVDESEKDAMRVYQMQRLRYYYAIVVFDSAQTADKVLQECDGMELEGTCNVLDLRAVEVEADFSERRVSSECTRLPLDYVAPTFETRVLGRTDVECTWDEGDHVRDQVLSASVLQKKTEEGLSAVDFSQYMAMASDSDDDGDAGWASEAEYDIDEEKKAKIRSAKKLRKQQQEIRAKYLALLTNNDDNSSESDSSSEDEVAERRFETVNAIKKSVQKMIDGASDVKIKYHSGMDDAASGLVSQVEKAGRMAEAQPSFDMQLETSEQVREVLQNKKLFRDMEPDKKRKLQKKLRRKLYQLQQNEKKTETEMFGGRTAVPKAADVDIGNSGAAVRMDEPESEHEDAGDAFFSRGAEVARSRKDEALRGAAKYRGVDLSGKKKRTRVVDGEEDDVDDGLTPSQRRKQERRARRHARRAHKASLGNISDKVIEQDDRFGDFFRKPKFAIDSTDPRYMESDGMIALKKKQAKGFGSQSEAAMMTSIGSQHQSASAAGRASKRSSRR